MWCTRSLLKAPGTALCRDYPAARLITLSRPGAMNTMTVAILRDLYRLYFTEPHANPEAVYVLRGDGEKAFCAGGDIIALSADGATSYRTEFYGREYELAQFMAAMPRAQVALWRGHALGSGLAVSLHGRHRVACETTRVAMPETRIGAAPDAGTSYVFSHMPMRALGAYMAITGHALNGADAFHAGLATHYAPVDRFDELETGLLAVRSAAEVAPLLDGYTRAAAATMPGFSLEGDRACIEAAFTVGPDTTVEGILLALARDGSPFAKATVATLEHNCPAALALALENLKAQGAAFGPGCAHKGIAADYSFLNDAHKLNNFLIGARALLVEKTTARPAWMLATHDEVDMEATKRLAARAVEAGTAAAPDSLRGAGDIPV